MNIGAAIFGVVCLACVLGGVVYVAAVSNAQPVYSDTYGNTYTATTNTSHELTKSLTETTSTGISVWLILIGAAVLICIVVFAFYAMAKAGGW